MASSFVTLDGELNLEDSHKDVKSNSTAHAHTSKLMQTLAPVKQPLPSLRDQLTMQAFSLHFRDSSMLAVLHAQTNSGFG